MYVCLCMGVSDREIKKLVREGSRSVEEIMTCTGAGTRCGSCVGEIACMVTGSPDKAGPANCPRRLLSVLPSSNAA